MNEFWLSAGSCFLLGVLTSIHPCPLTSNIAAISMLTGWFGKTPKIWLVVLLFISGYVFTLLSISILITSGVFSIFGLSSFLHRVIPVFFGPLLILVGMILSGLIKINHIVYRMKFRFNGSGRTPFYYAFPMGAVLALSFCPATAAIFFGLLIPMAVETDRIFFFPMLYATGLSIPLILISLVIHRSAFLILNKKWHKRIPEVAGWIMILAGMLITLQQLIL